MDQRNTANEMTKQFFCAVFPAGRSERELRRPRKVVIDVQYEPTEDEFVLMGKKLYWKPF